MGPGSQFWRYLRSVLSGLFFSAPVRPAPNVPSPSLTAGARAVQLGTQRRGLNPAYSQLRRSGATGGRRGVRGLFSTNGTSGSSPAQRIPPSGPDRAPGTTTFVGGLACWLRCQATRGLSALPGPSIQWVSVRVVDLNNGHCALHPPTPRIFCPACRVPLVDVRRPGRPPG